MAAALTSSRSQNKWPASPNAADIGVRSYPVNTQRGVKKVQVAEPAARALVEIAEWWDKNIEPIDTIYGYNYREIRGYEGTGIVSNHGSGTALDINASKHPLGAVGTIPADKADLLRYECAKRGLKWGGDYRNRKDEMHIEVKLSPEQFGLEQKALDVAREGSKIVRSHWKLALLALATGGVTVGLLARSALRRRRTRRKQLQVKT